MKAAIKRLRESKARSEQENFDYGMTEGRAWAEEEAEATELELLARIELHDDFIAGDVCQLLNVDVDYLFGDVDILLHHSPKFAEGFVTGALVVFAEAFTDAL